MFAYGSTPARKSLNDTRDTSSYTPIKSSIGQSARKWDQLSDIKNKADRLEWRMENDLKKSYYWAWRVWEILQHFLMTKSLKIKQIV